MQGLTGLSSGMEVVVVARRLLNVVNVTSGAMRGFNNAPEFAYH